MGEIKKAIGRDEESTLLLPKDGQKKQKKAELKAKKAKKPAKKKMPAK